MALLSFTLLMLNGCSQRGTIGRNDIKGDQLTIGIVQYQENQQAVDLKRGFVDYLREKGLNNKITIDNKVLKENGAIEGVVIERYLDHRFDLIYAILPDESAMLFEATSESDLPVIYTGKTEIDHSNEQVSGIIIEVPLSKQFQLMSSLLPNARTLGVYQNETEPKHYEELEKVAFEYGFMIQNLSEDVKADEMNADCIFIGKSVGNIEELYEKARLLELPMFGVDQAHRHQLVAIEVVNDFEIGRQSGELAYELMVNGTPFDELPIAISQTSEVLLNKELAEKFEINVPLDIAKRVKVEV